MSARIIAFGGLLLLSLGGPAWSQTVAPQTRGFVSVNGGYQTTANNFRDGAIYRRNAEDGRFDTTYTVKAGPTFDVAGGGIVWRRLGIGVGVSRFTLATPTHLAGSIPHPFFFNLPRAVSADVGGLKREELAVHVQARAIVPAGQHVQVMLFGGPSFFQVKQDVVTDFTYTDSYPYDEASFRSATSSTQTKSKIGFNAGGDFAFFFTRQVGVGAAVQFSGTTIPLTSAGGGAADVKVGGVQAGGGLRLRF